MMTINTTDDNAALAWLISQRSPHLSAAQLARAVRIEDRRDTTGRTRYDRTHRVALSPAIADDLAAPDRSPTDDRQCDASPLLSAACDRLASCGLADLIPHLLSGASVRQAALTCGISERTARHHLASIRENLAGFLADRE